MLTINKRKITERAYLIILFLFAVSFLDLAGYIFAAIVAVVIGKNIKCTQITMTALLIAFFSISYFSFYTVHNGFSLDTIILYLIGPWSAYFIGQIYIEKSTQSNAFLIFIITLAAGMLMHGILNFYAYIESPYFESYAYARRSVDFWRQELVNVNATGMFLTFATGISIGALFSTIKRQYKMISIFVLLISLGLSAFFANRTLIVIAFMIILWKTIIWFFLSKSNKYSKLLTIGVFLFVLATAVGYMASTEYFGEWFSSLKIVERFTNENEGTRFSVWSDFFVNYNFLRYLFGGEYITAQSAHSYLHNLWLDIYNVSGIVPFFFSCVITIAAIYDFSRFRNIALRAGKEIEYNILQCLFLAIALNCAVEPIIASNPYYFLIVMMFLGAMEGRRSTLKSYDEI